jgi:antibiotic biosynthesis monooxygenase (ABM) superfamily enzyme
MCVQVSSEFNYEELAFLAEQRRAEMFVTVSTYKAKAGEEDAIIALHEAWQRHQQPDARDYLSGELLRNVKASREFIAIMRFESQEAAQALTNDPKREAWYQRLVSLTEDAPIHTEYTSEWQES